MRILAPAKLNLFLHIGELRPDGFHDLESLVVFAEEADVLTIEAAGELSLALSGPTSHGLSPGPDNLVWRAARSLDANRGAKITLEKNLPVAAGIGGGSADAAAALRGLNAFWGLGRSPEDLQTDAAALGSDVPVCVRAQTAWMMGRGERVVLLEPLPQFDLVLVNPRIAVPTAAVYSRLNVRTGIGALEPPLDTIASVWDLVAYLADSGNDLEAPACAIAPVIDDVIEALAHEPGCVLAQMSGSGATCFGIFQDGPWAAGAADRLAQDHPDWWVRASRIAAPEIGVPLAERRVRD
jgi:4-diphosphocytidyl-2-C-methyl-D-erythritol kinase